MAKGFSELKENPLDAQSSDSDALTWAGCGGGYEDFLALASRKYSESQWELTAYARTNSTGYSWVQMRADDIPDIIDRLSTDLLDRMPIDGGVYLLPVNSTMSGIYYNKTLMEEHNWEVLTNNQ